MKIFHLVTLLFITTALTGVEGCDEELLARLQAEQQKRLLEAGNTDQASTTSNDFQANGSLLKANDLSADLNQLAQEGKLISATECSSLIETTPRGVACLHCTEPEAKEQSMVLVNMLHKSCLKNVAINYLVDGTFSFDAQLLIDQIALLSQGERTVFVYFYLTNGSTPRNWDKTTIDAFATQMAPEKFRQAIVSDPILRAEYKRIVMRLVPVIQAAAQYGAQVSLILGLEDNLTLSSFQELYDLTIDTLPPTTAVAIGRNPCPGCYPGNDATIPVGVFEEVHTTSPFSDVKDGVITNDGQDYDREDLESFATLRDSATKLNTTFILWDAERQGLSPDDNDGVYPHPSTRYYAAPSPAEQKEIIHFLRGFK